MLLRGIAVTMSLLFPQWHRVYSLPCGKAFGLVSPSGSASVPWGLVRGHAGGRGMGILAEQRKLGEGHGQRYWGLWVLHRLDRGRLRGAKGKGLVQPLTCW